MQMTRKLKLTSTFPLITNFYKLFSIYTVHELHEIFVKQIALVINFTCISFEKYLHRWVYVSLFIRQNVHSSKKNDSV